ncbi:MAG TPA: hypothetical protein VI915_04600 [Thermoplasmata archaeon]|nr:hypothetical protein [Thermoplasmata archaeon]
MLQKVVEQILRDAGWDVQADGGLIAIRTPRGKSVIAFVLEGQLEPFLVLHRDSDASLIVVPGYALSPEERRMLELTGVAEWPWEDVEADAVSILVGKKSVADTVFSALA